MTKGFLCLLFPAGYGGSVVGWLGDEHERALRVQRPVPAAQALRLLDHCVHKQKMSGCTQQCPRVHKQCQTVHKQRQTVLGMSTFHFFMIEHFVVFFSSQKNFVSICFCLKYQKITNVFEYFDIEKNAPQLLPNFFFVFQKSNLKRKFSSLKKKLAE